MSTLELFASLATMICVVLAVKRSLWQFPFGVLGTGLYFFVFWGAALYSSAALQVFFVSVQAYGWWYWMHGDKGRRPPIRTTPRLVLAALFGASLLLAGALSLALDAFTDANMALLDSALFGLSVVAQILLDRKRLENWPVWIVVNILSVWVYASQALWLTTGLYVFLFFNAFWGWWEWRREYRIDARPAQDQPQ